MAVTDTIMNGIVESIILKFIPITPAININPKSRPNPAIPVIVNILLGIFWNKVTSNNTWPASGSIVNG